MKRNITSILIVLIGILIYMTISFFKYDIFSSQDIKVSRALRSVEMYNSIFYPSFKTGDVIEYYENMDSTLYGKTIFQDGKIIERISFHKNGNTWTEIPINNCSIHGNSKVYYDNGQIQYSVYFTYGIFDGRACYYFQNGQLKKEANYRKGYYHGDYIEFDSLGFKILHEKYNNGQLIQ